MKKRVSFAILACLLLGTATDALSESSLSIARRMINAYHYEQAFPCLLKAVKEDPNNPDIHYCLYQCLDWMGWGLRALKECQIYLELAPDGPRAATVRAFLKKEAARVAQPNSNHDIWFRDYYQIHPYHSWDENPTPDWVKKHDLKTATTKEFGFDVHFVLVKLYGKASEPFAAWQRQFMEEFRSRWEKAAQSANLSGQADLYITLTANGQVKPVIVRHDGDQSFAELLTGVFEQMSGSQYLPHGRDIVIKAQIGCGMRTQNKGRWCAFTGDEDARPHVVTLGANFDPKSKEFTGTPVLARKDVPTKPTPERKPDKNAAAAGSSWANQKLSEAKQLIAKAQYQQAADLLWPLGEADHPEACLLLAKLYTNPLVKDFGSRMAFIWWEKAAELGSVEAQYQTGRIYEWCDGNYQGGKADAIAWYKRGAEQGSSDCQFKLGVFNEFGEGMPEDKNAAIAWYKKAAAQGNNNARQGLKRLDAPGSH